MKKIKRVKFNKIAALAIIVSVSASGSPTFAITSSNNKLQNIISYNQSLPNINIQRLSTTKKITKTQENIISNLFATYKISISKAIKDDFSSKLDTLINLGTITQLQKKGILNSYTINKTSSEELIDFESLVINETITKDQEIIIVNSFISSKQSITKTINDILLYKLDKLVLNRTINDDQRAAVINLAKIQPFDS